MRGGKWSVFAGVWMVWLGCNKATESREIKIVHVGGMPYANQPLVPFASDSIVSGWWTHDAASALGDTVWSDGDGSVTIDCPKDQWDGMICPLPAFKGIPRAYTIRFAHSPSGATSDTYTIPGAAFIQFVGNREGNTARSGCWLFHDWETPTVQPDRWITPGVPPSPSLIMHHWIHPEESLPTARRHLALLPNGAVHALPALLIRADMIGDTTRHPVRH